MKNNNMTLKNFKTICEKVGIDFESQGYEEVLNLMAIGFESMANTALKHNCLNAASRQEAKAETIEEELLAINYLTLD